MNKYNLPHNTYNNITNITYKGGLYNTVGLYSDYRKIIYYRKPCRGGRAATPGPNWPFSNSYIRVWMTSFTRLGPSKLTNALPRS